MAKVLWIGDAGTPTGFGKVAEEIGGRLVTKYGHEVHALAVMWEARTPYEGPLKLYRASANGNFLGYDRVLEMLELVEPDVVICNEDVPQLTKRLTDNRFDPNGILRTFPVIGYVPVDGYNVPPSWKDLSKVCNLVAMTQFGAAQLGIDRVIHHGVDREVFHPVDEEHPLTLADGTVVRSKAACREAFDIPQDAFVIGRVDTNTGRKDWGSTWRTINTAYEMGLSQEHSLALFHTKIKDPQSGVDLAALIPKGGGKYIVSNATNWPVANVVALMNCFSVFLSTSRGEGWGLTLAEAMACGVPIIATDGSAITEVVGPGGVLCPGKAWMTNPYGVDQVLADTQALAGQLVLLAKNPERRAELAAAGLEHIKQFSWDGSTATFHLFIEALLTVQPMETGGQITEA